MQSKLNRYLIFHFRIVPTVWYFRIVLTCGIFRIVSTVWYFRIVLTVWYFRIVPTVWYFRIVPTLWCVLFFILFQQFLVYIVREERPTSYNNLIDETLGFVLYLEILKLVVSKGARAHVSVVKARSHLAIHASLGLSSRAYLIKRKIYISPI